MSDRIDNASPFHFSALHALNIFPPIKSDDDRPLEVNQAPDTSSTPVNAGAAKLSTLGTMSFEAKSASGTHSTLLTDQPSPGGNVIPNGGVYISTQEWFV